MKQLRESIWTFVVLVTIIVGTASLILHDRLVKKWDEKYAANIAVTKMFDQDGCTAYTFKDSGAEQYFVKCRCGAEVKWSNGKVGLVACTQVVDPAQDLRNKDNPKLVLPAPPPQKK